LVGPCRAALTFGAAATDKILLLQVTNPPTPVGTQATNPVAVQVVASDGVTPMGGATVGWTTTNGATLSVCGGVSSCAAITDESGIASTRVTPAAAGVATITATRAGHLHPLTVGLRHTVSQIVGFGYIGIVAPYLYIAQGATLSAPITARVVSTGTPQAGVTVNFRISQGSGSLSSTTAVTNSASYASVTLSLTNFHQRASRCVRRIGKPVPNCLWKRGGSRCFEAAGSGRSRPSCQRTGISAADGARNRLLQPSESRLGSDRAVSIHRAPSSGELVSSLR
jgi:hypothetical protein